jgi:hypothetical protein
MVSVEEVTDQPLGMTEVLFMTTQDGLLLNDVTKTRIVEVGVKLIVGGPKVTEPAKAVPETVLVTVSE